MTVDEEIFNEILGAFHPTSEANKRQFDNNKYAIAAGDMSCPTHSPCICFLSLGSESMLELL